MAIVIVMVMVMAMAMAIVIVMVIVMAMAIVMVMRDGYHTITTATINPPPPLPQLPGVVLAGLTVVVSPLVSLIEDQVHSLQNGNKVEARAFNVQAKDGDGGGQIELYITPKFNTALQYLMYLVLQIQGAWPHRARGQRRHHQVPVRHTGEAEGVRGAAELVGRYKLQAFAAGWG